MTVTRSFALCLFSAGIVLVGLSGCTSKSDVFTIKEQDDQWFCTPAGGEEWRCQESDSEFEEIAKKRSEEARLAEEQRQQAGAEQGAVQSIVEEQASAQSAPEETTLEETTPEKTTPEEISPAQSVESTVDTAPSEFVKQPEVELVEQQESISTPKDSADDINETVSGDANVISAWVVQLGAYSRESTALERADQLGQDHSFKAKVFNTEVKGKRYFTLAAVGFGTKFEAQQFAKEIQQSYPEVSPWVRTGASLRKVLLP